MMFRHYILILLAATAGCAEFTMPCDPTAHLGRLDPPRPTWYVLGRGEVIALRAPSRPDWFIATSNRVDRWHSDIDGIRRMTSGAKAADTFEHRLRAAQNTKMPDSIARQGNVLLIADDKELGNPSLSLVWVDVGRIFQENPRCAQVWLDDGRRGIIYLRNGEFVEELSNSAYRHFNSLEHIDVVASDYDRVRTWIP